MLLLLLLMFTTSIMAIFIGSIAYIFRVLGNDADEIETNETFLLESDSKAYEGHSPVHFADIDFESNSILLHSRLNCKDPNHHHECEPQQTQKQKELPVLNSITEVGTSGMNELSNHVDNNLKEDNISIEPKTGNDTAQNKQPFDDFDPKEVRLGGTGLHWCKSRKSLERLIRLGVSIESLNDRNETPLHVAVRRRKIPILIGLLCHGANVEARNDNGETPLMVAAKHAETYACMLLLVFEADFTAKDKFDRSTRHNVALMAAKINHRSGNINQTDKKSIETENVSNPPFDNACFILAMLNAVGAPRCPDMIYKQKDKNLDETSDTCKKALESDHCTEGCSFKGNFDGHSYRRWPDFTKESLYKRHMFADIIDEKLGNNSSKNNDTSRLLCIDGGGMRGIIVCQIMIEIEKYLKRPLIEYFDWIGGTSAGAFVSTALCLGIELKVLRRICFDVKDEVFSGNRPYNSKFLERVLKRTLGSDARMHDIKNKKFAVTTVLADRDPCQLRFFRNYFSVDDMLEHFGFSPDVHNFMSTHAQVSMNNNKSEKQATKHLLAFKQSRVHINKPRLDLSDNDASLQLNGSSTIKTDLTLSPNEKNPFCWQAVRASAAAPFFFKPYGPYLDGGIISNNPTLDMMSEFHSYHAVRKFIRSHRMNSSIKLNDCSKAYGPNDQEINEQYHQSINEEFKKLDLVVTLGTGRARVIGRQEMFDFSQVVSGFGSVFSPVELIRSIRAARDLFKRLVQRSCQTEDHILDRAQAWCSSLRIPYFRINPPLAANMSIDDKRDEQLINAIWQAKLYMLSMRDQLKELARILDNG